MKKYRQKVPGALRRGPFWDSSYSLLPDLLGGRLHRELYPSAVAGVGDDVADARGGVDFDGVRGVVNGAGTAAAGHQSDGGSLQNGGVLLGPVGDGHPVAGVQGHHLGRVGGDESNVGFLLSNQRTKETKYYPCAGATEYSAMDSAEGQVQNLRYTATFPLLLNVAEQPTYFMALKDASELVKMYAMVNVNQYQIVATGATVAECESNYRQMLRQSNLISDDQTGIDQPVETDRRSLEGVIAEIRSAVVDGNSIYFLRFTGETDFTVRMSAADVPYAPLLNVGDRVRVWYYDGHVSEFWIEACDLELLPVSTPAEPDDAQPSGGVDA